MNRWIVLLIGVVLGWVVTTLYVNYTERKAEIRSEEYQKLQKQLETSQRSVEMLMDESHERIMEQADKSSKLIHKITVLIDDIDKLSTSEIKYRLTELTFTDDE